MITRIRQLYNSIDRLFDRASITKTIRISQEIREESRTKTAKAALNTILPAVRTYDRKALLKMIVSQNGIDDRGTSAQWEFFFDLLNRQAQLSCEWRLTWDEKADRHGRPRMEITVRPFPPPEAPLRQLVRDGHLLHRQLSGMWLEEVRRLPILPEQFRDTDLVIAELKKQGLDSSMMEFSLSTGHSPERGVSWMAQTRNRTYYSTFS